MACREADDEVLYYSSKQAFDEVLNALDSEKFERSLVENLKFIRNEVYRQMDVTLVLTKAQKGDKDRKSALEIEIGIALNVLQ